MPRRLRGNPLKVSLQATTQLNSSVKGMGQSGMGIKDTALQGAMHRTQIYMQGEKMIRQSPDTALRRATTLLMGKNEEAI